MVKSSTIKLILGCTVLTLSIGIPTYLTLSDNNTVQQAIINRGEDKFFELDSTSANNVSGSSKPRDYTEPSNIFDDYESSLKSLENITVDEESVSESVINYDESWVQHHATEFYYVQRPPIVVAHDIDKTFLLRLNKFDEENGLYEYIVNYLDGVKIALNENSNHTFSYDLTKLTLEDIENSSDHHIKQFREDAEDMQIYNLYYLKWTRLK